MNRLKKLIYGSPILIALSFGVVGIIWITYSDQWVLSVFDDIVNLSTVQTYKGWFFIIVSSLFIYALMQANNLKLGEMIRDVRKSRMEFETTFEQAPIGIVHHKPNEKWLRINRGLCHILGYTREELLQLDFRDFVHPEDLAPGRQLDKQLLGGERKRYNFEKRYLRKDGTYIHAKLTKSIVYDENGEIMYFVGVIEDITERKQTDNKLKKSLREKEILLAEIHHRVNNNLALISGLLDLELRQIQNDEVRDLFRKSQLRIKSIGKVHIKLYQAEDFSNVPIEDYMQDLVSTISEVWGNGGKPIQINSDIADVNLNVNQAIPCGLIMNELVTNAYKHAFPDNKDHNEIKVELMNDKDEISLIIADNGVGLPGGFSLNEPGSLGFTLVKILCKQLNASVDIQNGQGTKFLINFTKKQKRGSASNF